MPPKTIIDPYTVDPSRWLRLSDARTETKGNPKLMLLNGPAVNALLVGDGLKPGRRVFQRWKDAGSVQTALE